MNKIIKEKMSEIRAMCIMYNIKTLHLFGSASTGNLRDDSDIDMLISFKNIPVETYTDNYFDFHYDLEKLFNRKIDLVTDNSLSNPYLIESINKTKQLIYAE